jgi:hypothetical protein
MRKIKLNKKGGFRSFLLSTIVLVFCSFLLILFPVTLLNQTNPTSPVLQNIGDGNVNLNQTANSLSSSLDNMTQTIDSAKESLGKAQPSPLTFVFVIVKETVTVAIMLFVSLIGLIASFSNLMLNILLAPLGLPTGVILGVKILFYGLFVVGILLAIRLIRSGND